MGDPFQPYDLSPRRRTLDRAFLRALARAQIFAADHWLFILNVIAALYVGLAYLSPLLIAAGFEGAGEAIFRAYHLACHQYPERSFFVAGQQVAFCQRDVATFAAVTAAGLAYGVVGSRLPRLRWWVYALMLVPIGVDGLTQLVGWRESTWELRTVTGALFGAATVWFLYPFIERTMIDLREESLAILASAGGDEHSRPGGY